MLRLDRRLAPVKAAVLPLSRNADLSPKANDLAAELRESWNVEFDDAGAIGRRYRRQDEIGTPYCVTVDFDTLDDDAVTIRERDSMKQERVGLDQVEAYLASTPARLLSAGGAVRPAVRRRPDRGADPDAVVGYIRVRAPIPRPVVTRDPWWRHRPQGTKGGAATME